MSNRRSRGNLGKIRCSVTHDGRDLTFYREEWQSWIDGAASRVAREYGSRVYADSIREDGYDVDRDGKVTSRTYQVQLAEPCRGGGATPVKQVYLYG